MAAFSWSNANFNSGNNKQDKLSDIVDTVAFPEKEYLGLRFVGKPRPTAMHWITTLGKAKDGKKSKINSFPKACLGFNPETMEVDAEKCPYCTILELSPRIEVRQNVINRNKQENEPRRKEPLTKKERRLVEWNGGKHHIKDGKGKGGWTPVEVLTVTPAIGNPIAEITSLNKHKVKDERRTFGPDHPRFGFDVLIKNDPKNKSVAQIYVTQKGEITPFTEEELEYAIWDIPEHKAEEFKAAEKEAKRVKKFLCNREGVLSFPGEGEDEGDGKKKKKRNQYRDSFDDDDDVEDRKSKKKKKTRSFDEDEDEDDDDGETPFDTDDDEEDDVFSKPKKKKLKTGSLGKIKTKVKSRARQEAPKLRLGNLKSKTSKIKKRYAA